MVTQAFCPAQTSVLVDRKVARNPLLLLHSTVGFNCEKPRNMRETLIIIGFLFSVLLTSCSSDKNADILKANWSGIDLSEMDYKVGDYLYLKDSNEYSDETMPLIPDESMPLGGSDNMLQR